MTIKWNEVTWYSWYGTVVLFVIVVPVIAFYIGRQYEAVMRPATVHTEVIYTQSHEAATTTVKTKHR